jgi:transposase
LPECLDDFIDESNPVRVIDVFVDALDLAEMSFEGVEPAATGRPSYHPSVLLKLYIYRRGVGLLATTSVAIDGSKFKAVIQAIIGDVAFAAQPPDVTPDDLIV